MKSNLRENRTAEDIGNLRKSRLDYVSDYAENYIPKVQSETRLFKTSFQTMQMKQRPPSVSYSKTSAPVLLFPAIKTKSTFTTHFSGFPSEPLPKLPGKFFTFDK